MSQSENKQKTKDIKAVDIVTTLDSFDYVLCIKGGKLCKIKVSDLKKIV